MVEITPISSQIAFQENEVEEEHGFIVPEAIRKTKNLATVIAIGPNVNQVRVGDVVAFRPQSATEIEVGEETFLVALEESLLCIIG